MIGDKMTNNCTKCGFELPEEAEFCPNCGSRVERPFTCASCGAILPAGAVVCTDCGLKVKPVNSRAKSPNASNSVRKTTGGFVNPSLLPSGGRTPDIETNLFLERESCAFSAANSKFRIGKLVMAGVLGVIAILVVIVSIVLFRTKERGAFFFLLIAGACLKTAVSLGRAALADHPRYDLDRATKGEAAAMFNVGVELYRGELTVTLPNNTVLSGPEGAFAYFMDSARFGNAKGMYNVASCIEQGIGCQADKRCALEWYRNAHATGLYAAAVAVERLSAELSAGTR